MIRALLIALAAWLPAPVLACQTALLLAIDVSNSIDAGEYRLQTDGLAAALRDPDIVEEMVQGQVRLSVVQWSGIGQTRVSLPWTDMHEPADVAAFAHAAERLPRAFIGSNTAVGGIIDFGVAHVVGQPCHRWVIDISGDGQDNAGTRPLLRRRAAEAAGVQINGLAIEAGGRAVTSYFMRYVRTRDGFVMTADGYTDYPRALKAKIRREIAQVLF